VSISPRLAKGINESRLSRGFGDSAKSLALGSRPKEHWHPSLKFMKQFIPKAALLGLLVALVLEYPTAVDVFTSHRWILPQPDGRYAEGPLPTFEKVKTLFASLSFYWLLSSLAALLLLIAVDLIRRRMLRFRDEEQGK
jgi:hypothetical protein